MTDFEKRKLTEIVKGLTEEEKEIVIENLPKEKMLAFLLAEEERERTELNCIKAIVGVKE